MKEEHTLEESAIIPDALAQDDPPRGEQAVYYKSLKRGRLPTQAPTSVGAWVPGEWREVAGPLKMCANGLHACTLDQLIGWLDEEIWTFEYATGTEVLADDDKYVGRVGRIITKTRWGPISAALFAADCAEHVLYILEEAHPGDDRPRQAIAAARATAAAATATAAVATDAAAYDAASAAAAAAAAAAADAAAYDAASAAAADAAYAAAYAADAAAYAAGAAAYAAGAAAAARGAAAADAAYGAAHAADAAGAAAAARGAAATAARATADAADERQWQIERLRLYLHEWSEGEDNS